MSGRKRKRQTPRAAPTAGPTPHPRKSRRSPISRKTLAVASGFALVALVLGALFLRWLGTPRAGAGHSVEVVWDQDESASDGAELLGAAGVIDQPWLFHLVLLGSRAVVTPAAGPHLLADDLTPAEVLRRLVRLTSRARVRVLIPEGFNRFQIGDRLDSSGVCTSRAFGVSATTKDVLSRLALGGDSAEGYLFPAKYDLFRDSDPDAVVSQLVTEAKKRLAALHDQHADRFAELEQKYGFHEREILTLASVVEKEAARAEEQPIIASVFLNRLSSPDFRPARSLQSDPTAAYGCLVAPELESCRGYGGRVLPAMLRDAENPYNTYRHPGLPPGPIASPGLHAVEAVLDAATTDYLFFVATGDGRHAFSRTLEEHEANIKKPH